MYTSNSCLNTMHIFFTQTRHGGMTKSGLAGVLGNQRVMSGRKNNYPVKPNKLKPISSKSGSVKDSD